MKNPEVNRHFRADFENYSEEDVLRFIESAQLTEEAYHFAIADDNDVYQGTISLKNLDLINHKAEYAIVMHPDAAGKGLAFEASKSLIDFGFNQLGLNRIYLNVLKENDRANHLYQRLGFSLEGCFRQDLNIRNRYCDLNWYGLLKEDYEKLD